MKITDEWQRSVFPHGPLQLVAPGVWQVTGSSPRGPVPRNMVIGVLGDRTLWLHSVIALDEKTMDELERLGRPSVMVVPNPIHRMDARIYKNRFPDLKVFCPAAARAKVEQVVPVDDTCEQALGQYGIECHTPQGLKPFELAYLFPTVEGPVLVVTDALMNISPLSGWQGKVMGWIGSTGFFGITAIGRLLLLKDKKKFGQWLLSLASIPRLRAIAVAHGEVIKHNPNEHLRQAARRLILIALVLASASFGDCIELTNGKLVVQVLKCEPAHSYAGKLLRAKVIRSSANAVGSKVRREALKGQTVNFFVATAHESLCEFVKGKPVPVTVSETCCDGTVESPCLTGTSYTLTPN